MKTKRITLLFLTCLFCSCVCACGKSAEAKNVDNMILAIGEVDIDSETDISLAQKSYDMLTDKQKTQVEYYSLLETAKEELDSIHAKTVDNLILAIGEVNIDSETDISLAQKSYDLLTDKQKTLVKNYSALEAAKEQLVIIQNTLLQEKQEQEYKEVYEKAVKYEEDNQIQQAIEEFEKLPEGYMDVDDRLTFLRNIFDLVGRWTCDKMISKSNKGKELGSAFSAYEFEISDVYDGLARYSYRTEGAHSDYVNSSIFKGHADIPAFMINDGSIFAKINTFGLLNEDSIHYGSISCYQTGFGALTIQFSINKEGHLVESYELSKSGDITTVEFTYSKE